MRGKKKHIYFAFFRSGESLWSSSKGCCEDNEQLIKYAETLMAMDDNSITIRRVLVQYCWWKVQC